MPTPTDKLRDALADNIRRVLSGEVEMTDKRFEMLASMYRSIKATPYANFVGAQVVVVPIHNGWDTIGELVAVNDTTIELADAAPVRYPEVGWGRQLIPLASIASIRIPLPIDTEARS